MRVIFAIILVFLSSLSLKGQSLSDLQTILSKNKVAFLDDYIFVTDSNHLGISRWEALREIAPDFWEGVALFSFYIPPDKRDSRGNNYAEYRLSILSFKDSVFYYNLEKKELVYERSNAKIIYEPVKKVGSMNAVGLDSSFYNTFHVPLDWRDLFIDSVMYGDYCGFAATKIIHRSMVEQFVRECNVPGLLNWLRSPNSEKQLFAIDGLLYLNKNGYKLDADSLKIIDYVLKKDGTVRICQGCIQGSSRIGNVTKVIE